MDRQTDGRTYRPSYRDTRTTGNTFHYLTEVIYYRNYPYFLCFGKLVTERQRDRETDIPSYRDARTHLKSSKSVVGIERQKRIVENNEKDKELRSDVKSNPAIRISPQY